MSRILIVEGDPDQARALRRAFAKLRPDFTISIADSGTAAVKLMSEESVDAVITDLQAPEMDGFALLSWFHDRCPDVALFTMSAHDSDETAEQTSKLGASEHFCKPLDESHVVARLGEVLSQSVHGVVHNVSLASFLQLLEMERKSCVLTVTCDRKTGLLCLEKGVLIAAKSESSTGEAAAIEIVAWPSPSISISRHGDAGPPTINSALGYIVMEAMRLQDEAARATGSIRPASVWPLARRTFRPTTSEAALQNGTRALALVETATGNLLQCTAREDCPVGELARMAAQLLLQEAATLELFHQGEGVEELVVSTTSRCDIIRPLGRGGEFALLVFAPEETNLVIARLELEQFIAQAAKLGS